MPDLSAGSGRPVDDGRPCTAGAGLVNRVALDLVAQTYHGLFGLRLQETPDLRTFVAVGRVLQVPVVALDVFELIVEDGDQGVVLVSAGHPASLPPHPSGLPGVSESGASCAVAGGGPCRSASTSTSRP